MALPSATPIFTVGLDGHEDSVTPAVFRDRNPEALRVDRFRTHASMVLGTTIAVAADP